MTRVLLIGYGNALRGDDAIGAMAVEHLRAQLAGAPPEQAAQLEFTSCHQLTPELAEPLAHCDLAIFVDAAATGEPGTVQLRQLQGKCATKEAASLTHHLEPRSLLALAHALYGRAPEAMLVTGSGAAWESGSALSGPGRRALAEICRLIPRLLKDRRSIA
jgi:hydrogenase maturation protease